MYRSKAKAGFHVIDDKMIHTDSLMEATIIKELVRAGFSKKWRRTSLGLSFGYARYTPDVELCIEYQGQSVRAIVEFKAFSTSEFTLEAKRRMLVAKRYYENALPLLYVRKTKQWYEVLPDTHLKRIAPPTPGLLTISQLARPRIGIPVITAFGRGYSALPTPLLLSKLADGMELGVRLIFGSPKKRRSRRRR